VIVHENYDSSVLSNDIALLKLSSGLNLTSERVKPIDYENEPSDYIGIDIFIKFNYKGEVR